MSVEIVGVIVSFNGSETIERTIAALREQVDALIVVDNGSSPSTVQKLRSLLSTSPRVRLMELSENYGVGRALNVGAQIAMASGATWLLTMDQDTAAGVGMVAALRKCAEAASAELAAAIPVSDPIAKPRAAFGAPGCAEVLVAITSGNLVRLDAWKAIGGYNEDYFVDSVDFEFCLRLRKSGRKVVQCRAALMEHRLGSRRTLGPGLLSRFELIEHSPLRRYYMLRNHLFLVRDFWRHFPLFLTWKTLNMLVMISRVVAFGLERRKSLRAFCLAVRDFVLDRRGKVQAAWLA